MNSFTIKPTYLLTLTIFLLLSNLVSAQMISPLPDTTTAKVKNHLAPASQNDTVGNTITLDSKDFNQGFIVSPEELILGKVAGLRITSNSGKPGDGFTIQNRGISTFLTDNSPLYIVDNVPIVNGYININPNDIATVTVIKDAWAVALYGDRAAHGAIVITTKRGTKQLHVSYSGKLGVSNLPKQVEVFSGDEFRSIVTDHFSSDPTAISLLGGANTNWQNEIYRSAISQDHHVDVSGSVKDIPYRVAVGRTNQDGIIKTSSYNRTTTSASLDPTFFDNHLKISITFSGIFGKERIADENIVRRALQFDPTQPVINSDGSYFGYSGFPSIYSNPAALLHFTDNRLNSDRYIGNISVDYKLHFFPDMRVAFSYGEDYLNTKDHEVVDTALVYSGSLTKGSIQQTNQTLKSKIWNLSATYSKSIEALSSQVNLVVGTSRTTSSLWGNGYQYSIVPQALQDTSAFGFESSLIATYFRLGYSLKNRYFLNFSLRNEIDARYADNNKINHAFTASLNWKLKDESFLRNNNTISTLDLRAEYGVSGSNWQFGSSFNATVTPDLAPEKITTKSVGIDYGLFNNRIQGSIDVYSKTGDNLFVRTPNPLNHYFVYNTGKIKNSGVELSINAIPLSNKDWHWEFGFNAAVNHNKIERLIDNDEANSFIGLPDGPANMSINVLMQTVGYPINSFYVKQQVYNTSGSPLEGIYGTGLRHYHKSEPDWIMGVSSQLSYRNWDFAFSGRLNLGNYVYNTVAADNSYDIIYWGQAYLTNVNKSLNKTKFESRQYLSDYFVENASFFRMDYITLGYSFKDVWNSKAAIRLSATIQNAFVITNYSGIDPEVATGIDSYSYPRASTFSLGLNMIF
ncbi:MAG TPA: SusC/RagA family TonB-linked outer membrane protein [Williamwhitmania sp.]|nr:SusC/RagA family TonB-linked outer membrane protein [Williamwhitmania sp.]